MSIPTTSEDIRSAFLSFFEEKQHEIVPSASLVPENDSTILFTIAGMNQFKDVFLGTGTRPYKRAADTQKILRVSGKHNDLEEVGYDTYHHTFFEMLGNWSFGDYFKKEAITWAWELLVERWGLDPERLYATVHSGDKKLGLTPDNEAANLWKNETAINPGHILFFDSKDNFWMMGETGPCGPCSEVHIDLRSGEDRKMVDGKTLVNADHPEVIEIWNLVFIQYDALGNDKLAPLKDKHIDTGMGFERIVAALQGKSSTYDTDLFAPLFEQLATLSPIDEVDGYDAMLGVEAEQREKYRIAMRVIVDHVRTCTFAISDDVSPGNVGRNYVIRRILRRAVRYGYQTLGFRTPFLYLLVDTLVKKMGQPFPELVEKQDYIERVIKAEEEGFLETLGVGLTFFERITPYITALNEKKDANQVQSDLLNDVKSLDLLQKAYAGFTKEDLLANFVRVASNGNLPGELAFLFHDTYGFPVDLTELMVREQGLAVEMGRYDELMEEQKERARASSGFNSLSSKTEDDFGIISEGEDSTFIGYDTLEVRNASIRLVRESETEDGTLYQIVLDRTPFYAESGGQIGDTGVLKVVDDVLNVLNTKKSNNHILHVVDKLPANLEAPVEGWVDKERREQIKKHHTATHLLHAALRNQLGSHVAQKGSLVAPDRLRFDFSHYERITAEQLRALEEEINATIQQNIPKVEERNVPVQEALDRGATALFGEKYGDEVRVISFDPEYSIELCGGTHAEATGELGVFRFISEGSVAAGIRRIEAVVGQAALSWINSQLDVLGRVRSQFKVLNGPIDEVVSSLLVENKKLEKEIGQHRMNQLEGSLESFINDAKDVGGLQLITGRIDNLDMEALRNLGQSLRERVNTNAVSVLGTVDSDGEKAYLVATVSDDLVKKGGIKAGSIVGTLAKKVGGGGGGKPTLATAGGKKPEFLDDALAAAGDVVESLMA